MRLGSELWATITDTRLLIGGGPRDWPIVPQWRPYLGIDAGGYSDSSSLPSDANSTIWLFGRLSGKLSFQKLATGLGFKDLYLYADDYLRYLPETSHLFNYLKADINLGFTKDLGIGLEYTYGIDSPKFIREDTLNASLTLKF